MKKLLVVFALTLALLVQGGCGKIQVYSDVREVDQLQLIQVVGVDSAKDGLVLATAATGMGLKGEEAIVLQNTSRTIARAMKEMQNYTSKKYIFYGHTKYVLIGESAAARGLGPYLDYVERGIDIRLDTRLFIVKDGTANDVMALSNNGREGVAELLSSLEKDIHLMSESYAFTCGDVAEKLAENGSALISAITLKGNEGILNDEGTSIITSAGYAVISDGALAAFIDRNTARGVNLLIGKIGGDVAEVPDGAGGYAALRIIGGSTSYKAEFADGRLSTLHVNTKVEANLDELQNTINVFDDSVITRMEEELAKLETSRIEDVLALSKNLRSDFLGIGGKVRMKHPIQYDKIKESWDSQLAEADIKLTVTAHLNRTYDIGQPLESKKQEGKNASEG